MPANAALLTALKGTVILCEKPAVAKEIANALAGGDAKKLGGKYWEAGEGVYVASAVGHLLALVPPEKVSPEMGGFWNLAPLPWHPPTCPMPFEPAPDQPARGSFSGSDNSGRREMLAELGRLLGNRKVRRVIVACDAGREGEMIGREVLTHHDYEGRVDRLWISRMDEASILEGLARPLPGESKVGLYYAGRARAQADLIVGVNYSRAMTNLYLPPDQKGALNLGRVQTPTLWIVYNRDEAIRNFKPKDHYALHATFATTGADGKPANAILRHPTPGAKEDALLTDKAAADRLAKAVTGASVTLAATRTPKTTKPPELFSLLGLQKACNARFSWSADKTLQVAQECYETHKCLTYPRTEDTLMAPEQKEEVPGILAHLGRTFPDEVGKKFQPFLRPALFKSTNAEHQALTPTLTPAPWGRMNADCQRLYKLVCAHYLAALSPDYEYTQTVISTEAAGVSWEARGNAPGLAGWRGVMLAMGFPVKAAGGAADDLPGLAARTPGTGRTVRSETLRTAPPSPLTEGTLLEEMQAASKYVKDPDDKALLKLKEGIGTAATRAAIIEKLKSSLMLELDPRGKKNLSITPKGRNLMKTLLASAARWLADPGETAQWEASLRAIEAGEETEAGFLEKLRVRVASNVAALKAAVPTPARADRSGSYTPRPPGQRRQDRGGNAPEPLPAASPRVLCPKSKKPVLDGGTAWVFPGFKGVSFPKEHYGRPMQPKEYAALIAAGNEGLKLEGFTFGSRTVRFSEKIGTLMFRS